MDASSLIGKTIVEVLAYPRVEIPPAWVNEATTPIATTDVFLILERGEVTRISPCEVSIDGNRYPSLGLEVLSCSEQSLAFTTAAGKVIAPSPVEELKGALPLCVKDVVESDPLGEGAVSQIAFSASAGSTIILRHIMPPMMLGIAHTGASI